MTPNQYPAAPAAEARRAKKDPTKDNLARKAFFDARNKQMQAHGVRFPASGTFGGAEKKPKR